MKKKSSEQVTHVTDIALFSPNEGTFTNFAERKKIYVHLVPAPWSRVIVLSLVYAMAVQFVKVIWFEFVGKPQWHVVASEEIEKPDTSSTGP